MLAVGRRGKVEVGEQGVQRLVKAIHKDLEEDEEDEQERGIGVE